MTFLELLRDRSDECLEGVGSGALGDACSVCNGGDEILLGHVSKGGRSNTEGIVLGETAAASQKSI